MTRGNEPSTQNGKTERSGVLRSSVLVLDFALIKGVKPSLWLSPELQATAMGLWITTAGSNSWSICRHHMCYVKREVCAALGLRNPATLI